MRSVVGGWVLSGDLRGSEREVGEAEECEAGAGADAAGAAASRGVR